MKDREQPPRTEAPILDAALIAEDLQEQARQMLADGADPAQVEDLLQASREVVREPWPDES